MQTTTDSTNPTHRRPRQAGRRERRRRLGAGATVAMIAATTGASFLGVGTAGAQTAPPPGPQLPDVAAFVEGVLDGVSLGDLGTATGAQLEHLGAHLQPERRYHYAELGGGFELRLPEASGPGTEFVPESIEIPMGVDAVVVVDPTDPYVYLGGPCPQAPAEDRQARDDEERSTTDTVRKISELLGNEPLPVMPADLAGQDCGIGFSANGNIPVPATAGGDAYTGHVVVDGLVEVHPAVSLDGSLVARVDGNGVRATGFGDLVASVPFAQDLVDISIPFGDAGVELQADRHRVGVRLAGAVRAEDGYTLPLGVPLTLPAQGGIEAAMSFGMVNQGGAWVVDDTSFLEVAGELVIPLDLVARATRDRIRGLERREAELTSELARVRSVVRAERVNDDRLLADLERALVRARAEVSGIDDALARNNSRIATVNGWLSSEIRRFNSLPFLAQVAEAVPHGARVTGYRTEIAALQADNALQRTLRPAAADALGWAAQQVSNRRTSLSSANVDADWRVQLVIADRRDVRRDLGQLRRSGVVDSSTNLRGEVTLRIDASGVGGRLSASLCTSDGCTALAGGRVHVGQNPRACVTVPVIGEEVCARL